MDRQLKQRVVGAAVLVALGVVFIPLFLDNSDLDAPVPDIQQLPPPPADDFASRIVPLDQADVDALDARTGLKLPPEVKREPEPPAAVNERAEASITTPPATTPGPPPQSQLATVTKPVNSAPAVQAPLAPAIDLKPPRDSVEAWTVQLGSFANDANAKRLIDKLRDAGYPAYLERRVDGDNTAFKVRVGPHIGRAEAQQARDALATKFALKGILLRYR